jgi:putative tryptophan/tyrosine transport system substrate-binding protein
MDRRTFIGTIAGGFVVAPLDVVAQQMAKMFRIGVMDPFPASDPVNTILLRRCLADAGYVEGKSIAIEWRYAEGDTGRLPALAAELARLKLDAIMAIGDLAIEAARQATSMTPIIAVTDDLASEGHVANLAHPGGNVTGVSILASELNAKRLELLNAAVPTAVRVAVLWDPATGTFHLPAMYAVAARLGLALNVREVRRAEDLGDAFESARAWHAEALNTLASPLLDALRKPIIDQAARNRLPAIYQWAESAREGGLMAYGPTEAEIGREMCIQLDRVLKGAKPRDLPVEQPTKFELVINLKTAKALGITIPQSLLLRADEVIH